MKKYNAIIIGTGQAGVPLARALADKGWSIAVVEEGYIGGSCVNHGCTPTKTLVAAARWAYVAKNGRERGITASSVDVDFKKIMAHKTAIVERWRAGSEKRLIHENITLYKTHAEFADTYKINVGDEIIEGEKIFINTGAYPFIPPIPGLNKVSYLDSTGLLDIQALPKHLLVMGGGYVGVEFAQMFRRFGSEVTIIQRGSQLANTEDEDIAEEIKNVLEKEEIKILLDNNVAGVSKSGEEISLNLDKGEVKGSHLLVATGRAPATKNLSLEKAGVEITERGHIKTNERLETNVPNIWALGDVKGGPAFTHVSYHDYQIVYENIVNNGNMTTNDRVLVYAMFIDPSLGRAGLTKKEAKERGLDIDVAEYSMSSVARAIEMDETAGKMNMVVDKKTGKILGAAVLGYEGAELAQILAAYMNAGADYKVVQKAITVHPTLAEGIQSMAMTLE